MGKKAKFKAIRRIASQMPAITRAGEKVERMTGTELIMKGVKKIEGKPVLVNERYIGRTKIEVTVNHNREMKRLYNKHGGAGVVSYMQAVKQYGVQP